MPIEHQRLLEGIDWTEVETTGSTNTDLMNRSGPLGLAPDYRATARLAWNQTHGRGQKGRKWQSNNKQSLTFSLAFEQTVSHAEGLQGLTLWVGLTVVEVLEQIAPGHCLLKWPNDLVQWQMQDLHKLGGILVETRAVHSGLQQASLLRVVIGIGINWSGVEPSESNDYVLEHNALRPASIFSSHAPLDDASSRMARRDCAQRIAQALVQGWPSFIAHGFAPHRARYESFLALLGQPIVWEEAIAEQILVREGQCLGVTEQGHLAVQLHDGTIEKLNSASYSLRLAKSNRPSKIS